MKRPHDVSNNIIMCVIKFENENNLIISTKVKSNFTELKIYLIL